MLHTVEDLPVFLAQTPPEVSLSVNYLQIRLKLSHLAEPWYQIYPKLRRFGAFTNFGTKFVHTTVKSYS